MFRHINKEKENSAALWSYPIMGKASRVNPEDKSRARVPNTVQCYVQFQHQCDYWDNTSSKLYWTLPFRWTTLVGMVRGDVLHAAPWRGDSSITSP